MKRSRVDSAFPSNSGIDHVGVVTDSDLEPGVQRAYTNAIWQGETRGFFPAVPAEMLNAGFTPEEAGKIGGGNFLSRLRESYRSGCPPVIGLLLACLS